MTKTQSSLATERAYPMWLGVVTLLLSIISLCLGTSFAKGLFASIGPLGTTAFRLFFSAVLLWIAWRPWRFSMARADWLTIVPYGITLVGMNSFFYLSLQTIPLGIALSIEFMGPLGLAIYSSRTHYDFLWIILALLGLYLLLWPHDAGAAQLASLSWIGVSYAFTAGIFWALYIIVGQRARRLHPGVVTSYGVAIAAMIILPFGLVAGGANMWQPTIILFGLGVAILSSAIPYSLEIVALRILPRQTFSIMLSLEPAVGAVVALLVLGEVLDQHQWLAIVLVVIASMGCTMTAMRQHKGRG